LLRRGCANRDISSIRYDSLTHINVAFGYIKPNSYDIHPINGASIAGFKSITDLKQHAPNLQVWLSLGGWTFSDNDTDTQPVFGDLSSTVDKRFQFFTKLENFMLEVRIHS
jgi:chitinase